MWTWSSNKNSSVCPSVKRVDCDKTEERSVQIFLPYLYLSLHDIPYERSFSLVFWEEEWLVGATLSTSYFPFPFQAEKWSVQERVREFLPNKEYEIKILIV